MQLLIVDGLVQIFDQVVCIAYIIRFNNLCINCRIWSSELDNRWYKTSSWFFMMFLVLLEIYNFGLIDGWIVSSFRFLAQLWSNILVGFIIVLLLVFKGLLLDPCLKLLIDNKSDIFQDFNQNKKVGCY